MYSVTIYTDVNSTWNLDICFETYEDAKVYLIDQGYTEEKRWFIRYTNGWYGNTKAIINKMRIYKPSSNI